MKISEILARQAEQKNSGKPLEDRPRKPVDKKALKVIRTRETPNPKALQFVLNTQILETVTVRLPVMWIRWVMPWRRRC